jgi:hypothetical protein
MLIAHRLSQLSQRRLDLFFLQLILSHLKHHSVASSSTLEVHGKLATALRIADMAFERHLLHYTGAGDATAFVSSPDHDLG